MEVRILLPKLCRGGGIGRRAGLRHQWLDREGSSPSPGTMLSSFNGRTPGFQPGDVGSNPTGSSHFDRLIFRDGVTVARVALDHEMEVRILLPKPIFFLPIPADLSLPS